MEYFTCFAGLAIILAMVAQAVSIFTNIKKIPFGDLEKHIKDSILKNRKE